MNDWISVAEYLHPLDARTQADLAGLALQDAGIPVVVRSSLISNWMPFHTIAFGGVRVMVRSADADVARQVLGAAEEEVTEEPAQQRRSRPRVVFYWLIRLCALLYLAVLAAAVWHSGLNVITASHVATSLATALFAALLMRSGSNPSS